MASAKQRTVRHGTAEIATAMRARYPSNAYALLFEVGNSTGFKCSRHADAICMSLWPSRGLDVTGFEFKASRSDWTKELKDPAKAEAVLQYCDFWSLVVADRDIVKPGELPATWGLIALKGKSLVTITEPTRLVAQPWPKEFLAAVLRSAADPVAAVDDNAIRKAHWDGQQEEGKRSEVVREQLNAKIINLTKQISDFERVAGVSISTHWKGVSAKDFALAVGALSDGSHERHLSTLERLRKDTARLAETVAREVDAIMAAANASCESVS